MPVPVLGRGHHPSPAQWDACRAVLWWGHECLGRGTWAPEGGLNGLSKLGCPNLQANPA